MATNTNIPQGTPTWLTVVASNDDTGIAREGITYDQVDVVFKKSTQVTFSSKIITAGEWRESGLGVYEVLFSNTDLNVLGSLIYVINSNILLPLPKIRQFIGLASVVSSASYIPNAVVLSTNALVGNLIDLHGNPLVNAVISARIIELPSILGSGTNKGGVSMDLVSARSDAGGFFALEVVQGSLVDITIPMIGYRRTLRVPANVSDILFDLP